MRDLVVLALIGIALVYTLKKPWIGILLWVNLSLMSPHVEFTYAGGSWPVATATALATLVSMLFHRKGINPMRGAPATAILIFTIWITITLPFSFYFGESLPLWERSMKIFLMIFVTLALIDDKYKLNAYVATIALSLAYYGFKGGIFTILTAGSYRVWGPGGFIGGNNELALALIMTIPLLRYLHLQATHKWVRHGLVLTMALTAVTVLGTYSRGAFLGIAAMSFFLWLKAPNKLLWGLILVLLGAVTLGFMPEHWWDRMNTIQTYEEDDSALGRINAWWNAFNLANDRLFGGGFMIYFAEVFAMYSPDPARIHAAHSIYFQVLGEHGWIGLILFLIVFLLAWRDCKTLIRAGREQPELLWAGQLGAMIQVSLVGYATTGAFLSLSYFDLPYNLVVCVVVALALTRSSIRHLQRPRWQSA